MSRGGKPAGIVRCGRRWSSAMKALTGCLQLSPRVQCTCKWGGFLGNYSRWSVWNWHWHIFWRSWYSVAWFIVKLDIVDGTVSVTKCNSILLRCMMLLFHWPFCFNDDSEPCHRAKVVTNWKCPNNIRALTLPAQSQDMNPTENLWHKVTLETRDMSRDIRQAQVDRFVYGRLETRSHPLSPRQAVHSILTRWWKRWWARAWTKWFTWKTSPIQYRAQNVANKIST